MGTGILAVIVRVAVLVFAFKCMQNFDRGMKKGTSLSPSPISGRSRSAVFGTDGGAKDDKAAAAGPPSLAGRPGSFSSIALSTNPRSTIAVRLVASCLCCCVLTRAAAGDAAARQPGLAERTCTYTHTPSLSPSLTRVQLGPRTSGLSGSPATVTSYV
jgi:hypothetical protein